MPYSPFNLNQDPSDFDLGHITAMQPDTDVSRDMPPLAATPRNSDEDEDEFDNDDDFDEDDDENFDDEEDDEDYDDEDDDDFDDEEDDED